MDSFKIIAEFKEFRILELSKKLAIKYSSEITNSLDLIPEVDKHHADEIVADKKGDRILHAKWERSLIALSDKNEFAGIIIGYEREKENNNQYPNNCIYLSDLAVSPNFQKKGLGKFLCKVWLETNSEKGFIKLNGDLKFCVQTNKADWNIHVQNLYKSFGFQKIGEKQYGNRVDNIYSLNI